MAPRDPRNPPQRTASVSERIAQRFKELQRQASSTSSRLTDDSEKGDGEVLPSAKIDKGKGRAVDETPKFPEFVGSPPPMSPALPPAKIEIKPPSPMPAHPPPPILLAGLALPPLAVSDLLKRAATEMPLRPVKFPLIGEYKDCFTGEDLVVWLVDNVPGLGGSLDRAEDAAKDLCEREGLLRRIGEFGNAFENTDEAFYQFRPKVRKDNKHLFYKWLISCILGVRSSRRDCQAAELRQWHCCVASDHKSRTGRRHPCQTFQHFLPLGSESHQLKRNL